MGHLRCGRRSVFAWRWSIFLNVLRKGRRKAGNVALGIILCYLTICSKIIIIIIMFGQLIIISVSLFVPLRSKLWTTAQKNSQYLLIQQIEMIMEHKFMLCGFEHGVTNSKDSFLLLIYLWRNSTVNCGFQWNRTRVKEYYISLQIRFASRRCSKAA